MELEPGTGWLAGIDQSPSPNFDARPENTAISLLVVHAISLPPGEYGGSCVEDFFLNRLDASQHSYFREIESLCVSAHAFIRRDGSIIQFVSFEDRAWHAGASCFQGNENCNDFSIGIELEGTDASGFTDQQYASLIEVSQVIMTAWPDISDDRIVGHCDIAPGRKTDPGPLFDWRSVRLKLRAGHETR